ncbi:MAG: TRAP transporter large permease [Bosea sp.]|uniref:TRAP transporter large permease subunit n=1 Tax=Bosea sp. (in: a-proteobacteria) TaxID=1871050 RepID=UPI0010F7B78B|nr:TRAP transporter large permease [Bosea sp. (in: a-proteobacteria)]MCP4738776.1 TRAP transporter large permease [Bosea sp. (in: a-proteobacteria)]
MLWTLVLSLMLFIAIGMPIAFSMGLAAVAALLVDGSVPLIVLPQKMYSSLDSFPLLAIPLFILAGSVMNVGGITGSLIGLARALVGHLRGGLGHVTIVTNVLFSTISGSAAASAAAVGSMLIPEMKKDGYRPEDAAVINAAGAILGPVIPPSVVMVIYGAMTGLSIGTLLLAGIGPGILIALIMMAAVYVMAGRSVLKIYPRASLAQILRASRDAVPALIMPAIIVGGIMSGLFTATEAGVIAVAYGVAYALLTRRSTLRQLIDNVTEATIVSSSIMIILGGAALFGWIVAREGVPVMIADWLQAMTSQPWIVMVLILAVLLVVGIFIEPIPAMVMLVPVLQPIAETYGFNPYHFAMVVVFGVLLGSLTPPVAVLVLITCKIAKVDVNKANGPLVPMFLLMIVALFIIAFVPWISLIAPRWLT